jgi:hypothetical protein
MALNTQEQAMLSAQVPLALREELERLARRHDRSLSAELRTILRLHLRMNESAASSSSPLEGQR